MSAIGPGDWVECVKDSVDIPGTFVVGSLYQVTKLTKTCPRMGPGVQILGKPSQSELRFTGKYGWAIHLFRPIYRPKADLIESLKTPAKRERVPA
jgi:hypothetical protein